MNKKRITIAIVFLAALLIVKLLLNINKKFPDFETEMKQAYKALKEKEFIGVVISVKIDKKNHAFKTIFYEDSTGSINQFIVEYDLSNLYNNVSNGDSIIKKKGDYLVRIYGEEKDTVFYLDYGEKYK